MPKKKIVQDIVPSERRSIRKITVEDEPEPVVVREKETVFTPKLAPSKKVKKRAGGAKYLISFIIIFICISVIGIALSLSYSKAVVTITKKVVNFTVDGTFTAKKSPALANDLSYNVITVSDTVTETISATKGPLIQTKAKGSAIIYNNYSATPQTLVAGTRLSTTDGLIYRTATTVSVPGKKTTAGSISVAVVADQPGENYNTLLSEQKENLKLPGYKGTSKYDGFYAKFKTDIVGGFSGNKMTINADAKKEKIAAMQGILKEQLLTKLRSSIPKESILYDNAFTVEYTIPEPVMKGTDQAELTVKGIAYGATFNSDTLIMYIAGKEIRKFPSDTYIINGDRALTFKISNAKDFSVSKGTPLIFTLKGPVSITGTLNESALKDELRGIKLEQSNAIFAKYPSIANAYALITPFWLRSFPDAVNKISIEYKH